MKITIKTLAPAGASIHEAFAVAVLPGRPWLDVGCLCPNRVDPASDGLSDELRAIAVGVGGAVFLPEQN